VVITGIDDNVGEVLASALGLPVSFVCCNVSVEAALLQIT
jgi:hypothetical protein